MSISKSMSLMVLHTTIFTSLCLSLAALWTEHNLLSCQHWSQHSLIVHLVLVFLELVFMFRTFWLASSLCYLGVISASLAIVMTHGVGGFLSGLVITQLPYRLRRRLILIIISNVVMTVVVLPWEANMVRYLTFHRVDEHLILDFSFVGLLRQIKLTNSFLKFRVRFVQAFLCFHCFRFSLRYLFWHKSGLFIHLCHSLLGEYWLIII